MALAVLQPTAIIRGCGSHSGAIDSALRMLRGYHECAVVSINGEYQLIAFSGVIPTSFIQKLVLTSPQ